MAMHYLFSLSNNLTHNKSDYLYQTDLVLCCQLYNIIANRPIYIKLKGEISKRVDVSILKHLMRILKL